MRTLFISHSSLDRADTDAVCTSLAAVQVEGEPAFEVLVDQRELEAGSPWPDQLHEWLGRCHAGLILLTRNAVDSHWVLKEATILAWRALREPGFRVFIVQAPDVTAADLAKAKFAPLELRRIQQLKHAGPDGRAAEILGLMPAIADPTPLERLTGRLTDLFERIGINTVAEVSRKVCGKPLGLPLDNAYKPRYAAAIATRLICRDLGEYTGVDDLVEDLSLSDATRAVEQILWIVAPWWVDLMAAGRLARLLDSQPRIAAVMNGAQVGQFTALMYVQRAHPLSRRYKVLPLSGGWKGDPAVHFTRLICEHYRMNREHAGDDQQVIERLNAGRPDTYVVLPGQLDDSSIRTLVDRFSKLTFIIWPGEALEPDPSLVRVDWLEPPLDPEREEQQADHYERAREIVDSMPR